MVEGQTEEAFVNEVLRPELSLRGVYVTATRITTSRNAHRVNKGGFVNFEHLERDVKRLLSSDQNRYVGCMVDLYRLPKNVPRHSDALAYSDPYEKVRFLEQALGSHFGSNRFIPFVQLHEFESLLYSDPESTKGVTGNVHLSIAMVSALAQVDGNPELVNETPEGAPSKRLTAVFPKYQKVVHGVQIAKIVGLQNMRMKCSHFSAWVDQLAGSPAL